MYKDTPDRPKLKDYKEGELWLAAMKEWLDKKKGKNEKM